MIVFMLKIILAVTFVGGIIFLFLAGFSISTNLSTGVPWAKISKANIKIIFREINLPPNSLIYDLGCGDGRVLFAAERQGFRAIGYELSFYPYLKAWWNKLASGSRLTLKRKNFFKENLSPADAVFVFLVGKVMARVGDKLMSELKPGALVISYGFSLPGWENVKIINTKPSQTYVYKL